MKSNNPYYLISNTEKDETCKLGQEVRRFREARGLNRAELAESAHISLSFIEKLESGNLKRPPSYGKIRWLEKVLKTDTGQLLAMATSSRIMQMNEILPKDAKKLKIAIEYLEKLKK